MTKICTKCKIEKDISAFSTEKYHNGIYTRNVCKSCRNRQGNIEVRRARNRRYTKKNRKQISEREKNRAERDINFRLKRNLRSRIRSALKNEQKFGSAIQDLGCTIEFFKNYLEKQFQSGMTWDNYGFGINKWTIDHIKPLSQYNLSNIEEFKQATHYTNLKPMWYLDNIKKGSKYGNP
jgi:hypothetical protein